MLMDAIEKKIQLKKWLKKINKIKNEDQTLQIKKIRG